MKAIARRMLPLAFGAVVVAGTVAVVGTGPLLRGVLAVSPTAILAAILLTAVGTSAAAWRWRTVSSELGQPLPWNAAVAAYYRSQFLNSVLPGGVVGDVHRAYRQGRRAEGFPIATRAVATERGAGQLVQFVVTVLVLAALGLTGPLAGWLSAVSWVVASMAAATAAVLIIAVATVRGRLLLRREALLLRKVFGAPRAALSIAAGSVVVVVAHAGTFVVACLAVGIQAPPRELIGLAVIALAAASLPINVGGWGPREAVSASAFAVVGLGAGAGLAASTAFGVLTIIAVLPGAIVLVAERIVAPVAPVATVRPLQEERTA